MSGDVTLQALERLTRMPDSDNPANRIAGQEYDNVYFQGGVIANVTLENVTISPVTAIQLPGFRAALARVASENGNAKILCVGDSNTLGFGSNGSTTGDMKALSYPTQFMNYLNSQGVNAEANSFMGDGNNPFTSDYDPRITVGSGWFPAFTYVGGAAFASLGVTSDLVWAPTQPVDTFVIYYQQYTGGGTFAVDINGGAPQNQDTNGSNVIQTLTITGDLGINVLNLNWVSGQPVILGFDAYDSTQSHVSVINAGWYGSTSQSWVDMLTGTNVPNPIAELEADLVLICLGINDWNFATPIDVFRDNMRTIIQYSLANSDVAVISPPPSNEVTASQATQQTYVDVLKDLAQEFDVPFIDIFSRFVSYAVSSSVGMYMDSYHPNGIGYADMATGIFQAIGQTGTAALIDAEGTTAGFSAGAGTAAKSDSTFTGDIGTTAYTVGDIVRALKISKILEP